MADNRTAVLEADGSRVTWSYDAANQLLAENRTGTTAIRAEKGKGKRGKGKGGRSFFFQEKVRKTGTQLVLSPGRRRPPRRVRFDAFPFDHSESQFAADGAGVAGERVDRRVEVLPGFDAAQLGAVDAAELLHVGQTQPPRLSGVAKAGDEEIRRVEESTTCKTACQKRKCVLTTITMRQNNLADWSTQMRAIKARFDGQQIMLPPDVPRGTPAEVIVVFPDELQNGDEQAAWMKAQEDRFGKVWENEEDRVYDSL